MCIKSKSKPSSGNGAIEFPLQKPKAGKYKLTVSFNIKRPRPLSITLLSQYLICHIMIESTCKNERKCRTLLKFKDFRLRVKPGISKHNLY